MGIQRIHYSKYQALLIYSQVDVMHAIYYVKQSGFWSFAQKIDLPKRCVLMYLVILKLMRMEFNILLQMW